MQMVDDDTPAARPRLSRRDLLVGALTSTVASKPADAAGPVCAFAIRGLTSVLSGGMITLTDALNKVPGVTCTLEDHGIFYCENVDRIADTASAAALANQRLALIGHSFGGDCAVRVAMKLAQQNIRVQLVVAIDANWFTCPDVPANVAVAMSFYQQYEPIGRRNLKAVPGFAGRLVEQRIDAAHVMIDKSPAVHQRVIAAVGETLALP